MNECYFGDCRDVLRQMIADGVKVNMVATSPPYWGLRDYGTATWEGGDSECNHVGILSRTVSGGDGKQYTNEGSNRVFSGDCKCGAKRIDSQLGLEPTLDEFVANMVEVFGLVREILTDDGTCWINLGSSYASSGISASQSRPLSRAHAYGSDDTEPLDSRGSGYAYRDLCDECLADYQSHLRDIARNDQSSEQSLPQREQIARGNGNSDYVPEEPNVFLHDVPASTRLESWRLLRSECSRCASRVSSLSELCSDVRDAPLSARKKADLYGQDSVLDAAQERFEGLGSNQDIAGTGDASVSRMSGKAFGSRAYTHSTIPPHHLKPKDLIGEPWRVAFALQEAGWYLRSAITWCKPAPMPESVTDRPTKATEQIFLLAKNERYFYDAEAVKEKTVDGGTRNKRDWWVIPSQALSMGHFATFPEALVEPMILAGTSAHGHCPACGKGWVRVVERVTGDDMSWRGISEKNAVLGHGRGGALNVGSKADYYANQPQKKTLGWQPSCAHNLPPVPGVVFDPFLGSGTTAKVAQSLGRNWLGIELNKDYGKFQDGRITQHGFAFS